MLRMRLINWKPRRRSSAGRGIYPPLQGEG